MDALRPLNAYLRAVQQAGKALRLFPVNERPVRQEEDRKALPLQERKDVIYAGKKSGSPPVTLNEGANAIPYACPQASTVSAAALATFIVADVSGSGASAPSW